MNRLLQRKRSAHPRGPGLRAVHAGAGTAAACSHLLGAALLELTDPRATFFVAGILGLVATMALTPALTQREPPAFPR